jgi:lycopene beta-cyclase
MHESNHYDIIIAGAGAAGLSLLRQLLQSDRLQGRRILLADLSFEPVNDKTWCFWDAPETPFRDLVYHAWDDLEVRTASGSFRETLSRYRYYCIRSSDYRSAILALARSAENVTLLEAEIEAFRSDGALGVMQAGGQQYTAPMIFQSALHPPGYAGARMDISLKQHFMGWEIEADDERFDPARALFMDFDVPQQSGVTFFYLLPFSRRKALVEYTLFSEELLSDEQYEAGLTSYISDKIGLEPGSYRIERTEKGVIPMEDRRYPRLYCPHVYNIGIAGGQAKPSTGYTFTRIQQQSAEIVKSIEGLTPGDEIGGDLKQGESPRRRGETRKGEWDSAQSKKSSGAESDEIEADSKQGDSPRSHGEARNVQGPSDLPKNLSGSESHDIETELKQGEKVQYPQNPNKPPRTSVAPWQQTGAESDEIEADLKQGDKPRSHGEARKGEWGSVAPWQQTGSESEKGLSIQLSAPSPYRFRVYDMMLLYNLKHDPDVSLQIFHDLFKNNRFDHVLKFLNEETGLLGDLKIMSSVPYTPFLKSIWKMKHRIFTGA